MSHENEKSITAQEAPSLIDALARRIQDETGEDMGLDDALEAAGDESADEGEQGPRFDELGLHPALCRALKDAGYTQPTGVQVQAIPAALDSTDLLVASSTGSGKTAAFMLPSLQRVLAARGDNSKRREKGKVQGPRVLVLAPTRELAMQVAKAAVNYGQHIQGLRVATVVGGVPYAAQLKALRGPVDVLIATPGRLLDHMGTGAAVLSNLEVLVLDEADRMLDMGFIDDIETIAAETPENRQTLMFSATFAGHVGQLAQRLTKEAVSIEVASHTDSHDNIEQRLHLADSLGHKNQLLDHVLTSREVDQAVIFTSTQRDADILADRLADLGHAVAALHGGMPQGRRNRVLQALRHRQLRVLVATDVAARGIDVPTITHVINYGMPMKPEDYVHRIGRTGRAGRSGLAITLCERRDIGMMKRIERFTTQRIPESVIEGLEPKMKPMGERGPRRDKPMPGQRKFEDRREKRFSDRPFGDRGDRGQGERAFGDRPQGDRPFGAKPFGSKPFGEKRFGESRGFDGGHEGRGERPHGDREARFDQGDRRDRKPFGEQGFGHQGKPTGKPFEKSFDKGFGKSSDRAAGDKSFGDKKAFGNKPFGGKPSFGGKPGFKSGGSKPSFGGTGKRSGGFGHGKREA